MGRPLGLKGRSFHSLVRAFAFGSLVWAVALLSCRGVRFALLYGRSPLALLYGRSLCSLDGEERQ